MQKQKARAGQAFLFQEETTDDVVRKTFQTPDEKTFKKERKRKVKVGAQPIPAEGSCCDRCQHYQHADRTEEFGICRKLGVTNVTALPHLDRNVIVDAEDAWKRFRVTTDPLRCKPWAGQGCSGFADVHADEVAA